MHLEDKKISKKFFWLLFILYAIVYMTKNNYSAAMAAIVSEGVLTKTQTGFINSAYFMVYAPLQILGGYVADRYNPEKMIKISLFGSGIANAVIFLNQDYYVMLAAWVFNAIVQFALWPSLFKVISSQLEKEYRVKGIYYISFASNVGLVMAYFVAMFMPTWKYNFILSALMLMVLTVVFHVSCKRVDKYMVPDVNPQIKQENTKETDDNKSKISNGKLFSISGFWFIIVVSMLYQIVSNGIKTLSSTFLMESYANVSPSIGNLLNIFIIIAGILGVAVVNQFLYPIRVRSEVKASLILVAIAIPFGMIMLFVGKLPIVIMIIALCFASALLSGVQLLGSRCSVAFAKYGKNGTAAGLINAAASIAIMIQSYGIVAVADNLGWNAVMDIWIKLLIGSAVCLIVALPLWDTFKKRKF